MQLTTEDRGAARIITVHSPRIDAAVAIQFKEAVRQAAAGRGGRPGGGDPGGRAAGAETPPNPAGAAAGPAAGAGPGLAPERVVLDLSDVTFLDSSGLGALVAAMKLIAPQRLDLAGLTPNVARVFRLTRMDTVFVIHPTAAEAAGAPHRYADAG